MSKIRIIKNNPPEGTVCSDISQYIGLEFEVYEKWADGAVDVILETGQKTIFPDEFEWVES
jgi:hypothetical protein